MNRDSIFITQDSISNNISGRITYTNIIETIPKNHYREPQENLLKTSAMEYRWRFLILPTDKFIVEISKYNIKLDQRLYFNKNGKWIERVVDPIYDQFVVEEYYAYC